MIEALSAQQTARAGLSEIGHPHDCRPLLIPSSYERRRRGKGRWDFIL